MTDCLRRYRVLGSFNDWQFFTGESMNPDGMVGESRFLSHLPSHRD